jgi:8-amino-7-oxononanoate synthase
MPLPRSTFDFSTLPEYELARLQRSVADLAGIANPFFRIHEGIAADTTAIGGRTLVNFSSYDYLGFNGDPRINDAAKSAIDRFGTTVAAARLGAGERQFHRDLEKALADLHGVEDAIAFVSGHATNVTTIGRLFGPDDLIVADVLVHNSVVEGAKLSGAKRLLTPHNDLDAVERALRLNRARHRRALIAVEGLYSMDGDVPDLGRLIEIKRRYNAILMVDEAHSIGVLGRTGRGIAQEQGIDPREVELWMGTLSKSFAACGGYIAGDVALVELLKTSAPGFVYSVGLSPPLAASAGLAVRLLSSETERVARLRANGSRFLKKAKEAGLDTGRSIGASVVPVIVGESPRAVMLSNRLFVRGINVAPIIFPGVAERQARLRFFLTARHKEHQIDDAVAAVAEELEALRREPGLAQLLTIGQSGA